MKFIFAVPALARPGYKLIISFKLLHHIRHLIVISGPTASGKTALAITVARQLGSEIVSADSRQIYKEMSIGVARPSLEELQLVKHHLIGSVSVVDEVDVASYESSALKIINELFEKNDHVILVGGSGMYIDAVIYGLDEMPSSDPEITEQLQFELTSRGLEALADELKLADPAYYELVDRNNPVRVLRALNVIRKTGKPFSSFRTEKSLRSDFQTHFFYIDIDREILYSRIDQRVDQMISEGLEDEVKNLSPYRHLRTLNTVGYSEWPQGGEMTPGQKDKIIEKIKQHSRNYAKRQVTWFRKKPVISIPWNSDPEVMKVSVMNALGYD